MDHRIILFRGMNTGGVRVPVGDQKTMAQEMGLARPRTLLASGNLVVESDRASAELEAAVEAEMASRFDLDIAAMVRTSADWAELVAANPFPNQAAADPARVLAMAMKDGVAAGAVEACRALAGDTGEAVEARSLPGGDVMYFWLPNGQGRSAIFAKATPRLLGTGTGRNWNTVLKLAEMVAA